MGAATTFGTEETDQRVIFKTDDVEEQVKMHLVNVYLALMFTLMAAAAGVGLHLAFNCGGMLSGLGGVITLAALSADPDKSYSNRRLGMLMLFGALQGASMGGLVAVGSQLDPAIVLIAALATVVIFACFAGAALVAKRRSYLYIGGTLSALTTVMTIASIANIWMQSSLLLDINVYIGLAMFCGYVVYDSQLIVEKAHLGSRDVAWHAAELFIDFAAIFVRVMIILIKNSQKSEEQDRRKSGTRTAQPVTARR